MRQIHHDESAAALMRQVGERVYTLRKRQRLSRRELSERSDVSPRYLARLEGGDGNISIGLLQRIAIALGQPVETLMSADSALSEEMASLTTRFRQADAATRSSVLRLLDPERLRERKADRICLIGLRGAGKSTLGARLSEVMQIPFIELNKEIERSAGMPLGEVIAMYGEEGYRTLEAETLSHIVASHTQLVLAVAGGVVEKKDTFNELLERFHSVWLKALPEEHMTRVRAQGDLRPMAGNPRAMDQLRDILVSRESLYSQAEYHLDTSGRTVDVSLTELRALIESPGILASAHDG